MTATRTGWWESPYLWMAIAAATLIPSAIAQMIPLTDVPNHIARFHVFLNYEQTPVFQEFYNLQWHLVGNLGVDILVRLIGPFLGAELSARLVIAAIPPLTIAGIYALSRAFNGRVSPAALLATPLAFNWPLNIGLINFNLSAALAMLVLALWIRLREHAFLLRFAVFAVLSFMTWVAHTAGWGLLGLGVFGYEVARLTSSEGFRKSTLFRAAMQTLPFLPTLLVMVFWNISKQSRLGISYQPDLLSYKVTTMASLFREYYAAWDIMAMLTFVALLVAFFIALGKRLVLAPTLIFSLYALMILLGPDYIFQSGFVDRRLLPYACLLLPFCIALVPSAGVNPSGRRIVSALAVITLVFFASRMTATAMTWAATGAALEARLAILSNVPEQSRMFNLAVEDCGKIWPRIGRIDHLQTMALVRRNAAVSGLFQGEGFNEVTPRLKHVGDFDPNMTALVRDESCLSPYMRQSLQSAMAKFPRESFDYVWVISNTPLPPFDESGLTLIDTLGNDRMYKVNSTQVVRSSQ